MTYTEFKNKWLGKGIDFDGRYANQCTDVYRMYCKEVLNIPQSPPVVGAKNIWDSYLNEYFERISNTPEGVPAQGDVVIWGHGTYGHVGVCDSADINQVTCFEQNWVEMDGSGVTELRKHTYKDILGWLKPISITQNMTTYKGYDLTNLDSMKVAVDVLVQLQSGELVRKEDLANIKKDLEALKKSQEDLTKELESLKQIIEQKDGEIGSVTLRCRSLEAENQKLSADIEYYKPYKSRYEEALQKIPNSATGIELIIAGIKKLLNRK